MFKKRRKLPYKYNNVQRQPYIPPQQTYNMQQQAAYNAGQAYLAEQQAAYNAGQAYIPEQQAAYDAEQAYIPEQQAAYNAGQAYLPNQQPTCVAPQFYNPQQQPSYNTNQQYVEQQVTEIKPISKYMVKPILTNNELNFYKQLRPVAEKLGYTVLTKVRIADFIEPCNCSNKSEKQTHFNRIKSKHVDFALARKDNLQPILLIELDDSSHVYNQKTVERDNFVNQVYSQAEIDILHMNNTDNLEYTVTTVLNDIYNRYRQAVSQMI